MKYEVSKDMSAKKVRDTIKTDITKLFLEFLQEKFGTADMIRTVGTSPGRGKNELAVCVGTVEEEGVLYPVYASVSPTVKEWKTRPYGKSERKAFDFETARAAYAEKSGSEDE